MQKSFKFVRDILSPDKLKQFEIVAKAKKYQINIYSDTVECKAVLETDKSFDLEEYLMLLIGSGASGNNSLFVTYI